MPVDGWSPIAERLDPILIASPQRRLGCTTFHTCLHACGCIAQSGGCDVHVSVKVGHAGPATRTYRTSKPPQQSEQVDDRRAEGTATFSHCVKSQQHLCIPGHTKWTLFGC